MICQLYWYDDMYSNDAYYKDVTIYAAEEGKGQIIFLQSGQHMQRNYTKRKIRYHATSLSCIMIGIPTFFIYRHYVRQQSLC